MIKLSKMTDYAVVILAYMAETDQRCSASALANATKLPEPTVSKILKCLAAQDILSSTRGINGGYALKAVPSDINMATIITAIDGPIALTACVEASTDCCDRSAHCKIKGKWNPLNVAMQNALQSVSLQEMIGTKY